MHFSNRFSFSLSFSLSLSLSLSSVWQPVGRSNANAEGKRTTGEARVVIGSIRVRVAQVSSFVCHSLWIREEPSGQEKPMMLWSEDWSIPNAKEAKLSVRLCVRGLSVYLACKVLSSLTAAEKEDVCCGGISIMCLSWPSLGQQSLTYSKGKTLWTEKWQNCATLFERVGGKVSAFPVAILRLLNRCFNYLGSVFVRKFAAEFGQLATCVRGSEAGTI